MFNFIRLLGKIEFGNEFNLLPVLKFSITYIIKIWTIMLFFIQLFANVDHYTGNILTYDFDVEFCLNY